MASKNIVVAPVDAKVVTTRNYRDIRLNDGKRFFGPIRSAVACVDLNERSVLREVRSLDGLKKDQQCSELADTLIAPDPHDLGATTLELDEMWSFVLRKTNQSWVWLAICRKTRQVVAHVTGDRGEKTCRELWNAIPEAYRSGTCYTDFWKAYALVIPDDQHEAVGKETGETAHIERFNNTIWQRLARFVRKTLSFSKSQLMHDICLRLFLWRYNMDIRQKWLIMN